MAIWDGANIRRDNDEQWDTRSIRIPNANSALKIVYLEKPAAFLIPLVSGSWIFRRSDGDLSTSIQSDYTTAVGMI